MGKDMKESKDQDNEEGLNMNNQAEISNVSFVTSVISATLLCIPT